MTGRESVQNPIGSVTTTASWDAPDLMAALTASLTEARAARKARDETEQRRSPNVAAPPTVEDCGCELGTPVQQGHRHGPVCTGCGEQVEQ